MRLVVHNHIGRITRDAPKLKYGLPRKEDDGWHWMSPQGSVYGPFKTIELAEADIKAKGFVPYPRSKDAEPEKKHPADMSMAEVKAELHAGTATAGRLARLRDEFRIGAGHEFNPAKDRKHKLTHDCDSSTCQCDDCSSVRDAQPQDYFKRVDEHLKTLSSPELKEKFLRDQFAMFEQRYNDFQRKGGKGGPNESSWTYTETLSHLQQLMGQL